MSGATRRSSLRRAAGASLLVLIITLPRAAHALNACTAGDITLQDNQCPAGVGLCTVSKTFVVGDGCVLDFGPRAVRIAASGELTIASGAVLVRAASLAVAAGGRIDGRGTGSSPPSSRGGMLTIETTGAVTLEKASLNRGTIDVSANADSGVVLIRAGGTVTIAGRLTADALATGGAGGSITIRAGGDLVTVAGSVFSATGSTAAGGGTIDLSATGRVVLAEAITISGGNGGSLDVAAGADIVADTVDASGSGLGGSGGCVSFSASTGVQLLRSITANGSGSIDAGGGCGGALCAEARFGDLIVKDALRVEGGAPDGGGGDLDLSALGSVRVDASLVSARSDGEQGCGGELGLDAGLDVIVTGRLDASGGSGGNSLDLNAGRDVILSGAVRLDGRNTGGFGGEATIAAGISTSGQLSIGDAVDVSGGGCGFLLGCGQGGQSDLSGCLVTITSRGQVLARGAEGGSNALSARDRLTIAGRVDATTTGGGGDGFNSFTYRTDRPPQQTGTVTPAAVVDPNPPCTLASQGRCLLPCPVCGDGVKEFPETCDTVGSPQSCDGCSVFCRIEDPTCNDGDPCSIDRCSPAFGCDQISMPCTTTTTTTTTTRPSTSSTSSTTSGPSTTTSSTTSSTRPTSTSTTSSTSTTRPPTTSSSTSSTTTTRPPTTSTSTSSTTTTRPPTTSTSTSSTTTTRPPTTSTSTTTLPTTTTLPPPPPCTPADCDDGNPCTNDACTAQGCRYEPVVEKIPAATCVYEGSMLRPPACGSPLPTVLSRPFDQARSLIERSGSASTPKKARAFVRKAVKALRKGGKGITKATKKHTIGPDCAAELSRGQAEALRRAQALL